MATTKTAKELIRRTTHIIQKDRREILREGINPSPISVETISTPVTETISTPTVETISTPTVETISTPSTSSTIEPTEHIKDVPSLRPASTIPPYKHPRLPYLPFPVILGSPIDIDRGNPAPFRTLASPSSSSIPRQQKSSLSDVNTSPSPPSKIYTQHNDIPDVWMINGDKWILHNSTGFKRILCELWVTCGRGYEWVCLFSNPPSDQSANSVYLARATPSVSVYIVRKVNLHNLFKQSPYFMLMNKAELVFIYQTCIDDYKYPNYLTAAQKFFHKLPFKDERVFVIPPPNMDSKDVSDVLIDSKEDTKYYDEATEKEVHRNPILADSEITSLLNSIYDDNQPDIKGDVSDESGS